MGAVLLSMKTSDEHGKKHLREQPTMRSHS